MQTALTTPHYRHVPNSERPRTYESGRRCHYRGCKTYLNQWNPGPNCLAHSRYRRPSDDLRVLMEMAP